MTARRGLFVLQDASNNNATAQDARLALAGLIAIDGSSALAARNGVLYDGVATNVVAGTTDTGTMTYQIRAGRFVLYPSGSASDGVAVVSNDANLKVNTTVAPGSNSRIDVIWVRQQKVSGDGGSDSANLPAFGVTQGTAAASPSVPSIPTGALALVQAVVTSGTTQTSTVTMTQVHNWTVAAGAPIPVRNATERNALTAFDGLEVYRLDNHIHETYNGSAWVTDPLIAHGNVAITPVANVATSQSVSFPAGLFSVAPDVQTTPQTTVPGSSVQGTSASSITTSGCLIWVYRVNTASTSVAWQAAQ